MLITTRFVCLIRLGLMRVAQLTYFTRNKTGREKKKTRQENIDKHARERDYVGK